MTLKLFTWKEEVLAFIPNEFYLILFRILFCFILFVPKVRARVTINICHNTLGPNL